MTLRLLSYNVRYAGLDTGENAWERRRDGVASLLRFHDPDLVCLQEVWQDQLADLRARLPGYEWVAVRHCDAENTPIGYRPDRLTPTDEATFSLSETPDDLDAYDWESAVPRVTTTARFRTAGAAGDRSLRLVNTHFDHASPEARLRSAELLCARFDDAGVPTLFAGDFNCAPDADPHERFRAAGFDDARSAADCVHGPETTFNDFGPARPGRRLDYVLLRGAVDVRRFGVRTDLDARGLYPSDHFAVVADIDLG